MGSENVKLVSKVKVEWLIFLPVCLSYIVDWELIVLLSRERGRKKLKTGQI